MRAVVVRELGAAAVLRVEEAPAPAPAAGEVLVAVRAAGVNPVEAYLREGTYTRKPALPWTPGSDGAGEVVATGEGVAALRPGDRVWFAATRTGAYASLAACPASQVRALPANASFEAGAALGVPYTTAWRALHQVGRARPGERVLVHGASGGVGIAAVQMARALGAVVAGTASTPEGRALVMREGAHVALDHGAPGYLDDAVARLGGPPDLVVEMLADRNLAEDLRIVATFGRVVVVGSRGSLFLEPRAAMTKDASVLGMSLFNCPPADRTAAHAAVAAGLEAGFLRPVIGARFPLAEAPAAHESLFRSGAKGKVVLVP